MNAKQKLHQIHLQEWTVRFAEQKVVFARSGTCAFHTQTLMCLIT